MENCVSSGMDWSKYFVCDAKSGTLTWKQRDRSEFTTDNAFSSWNGKNAGTVAGTVLRSGSNGSTKRHRIQVKLNGKTHRVHRIVWEMTNGPIPQGMEIDHINRDATDNSISNLRLATHSQNGCNKGFRGNEVGLKGVRPNRTGRYVAHIKSGGRNIYLGLFLTKGEAAVAYAKAAIKYHGAFASFK